MGHEVRLSVATVVNFQQPGLSPVPVTTLPFVLPFFVQDVVDATNRYMAIAYNAATNAALADAYSRMVVPVTITSWTMNVSTALTAGQTLSFRFVINGTPDATMVISMVNGDSSGVANGSLAVAQDSLIAVEGIVGGGLVSKTVRGGCLALRN